MSLDSRRDPVLAYNFLISLYDSTASTGSAVSRIALSPLSPAPVAGFSECSGLDMTMEVEDYQEGGLNGTVLKFPKHMRYADLTLRRGVTKNTDLFDWFYSFTIGAGKRKDGLITLCDAEHKPFAVWGFKRGLPIKYAGPQLNAQQNQVAIESITIAHEGLYQMAGASQLAAAVGEAAGAIRSLF